jgi:endonuclease YncB( thermonuclease family)
VALSRIHPGIAALAVVAFVVAFAASAWAAPIEASDVRVIDGDTIRVYHKQPNVRLVGFNAPETRRAACAAERELAQLEQNRPSDIDKSTA